MKILFVDDSKTVCAVYVRLLTENGYKVFVAHSMDEALEVARREHPQLAVIDFYMPGGNGDELTRALLQAHETASIVVAIHSQFPDVVKQSLKAGAVEMIGKNEPKDLFMMRVNALRSMVEAQTYQRNIEQLLLQQDLDSRPITILLVDDSPTIRAIYGALLRDAGFEVLEADSIGMGRTIARVEQPDMMLVDYILPDGKGNELVQELLEQADTSAILMVMFSQRENLEEQALNAGAIDILSKDDSHENFIRRIRSMRRYVQSQRKQRQIMLESRKQISSLLQKADQANQAKDDFLASMSHELRTPLTSIIGNSEILTASALSGEQRQLLQSIEISSQGLLSLVNDILDLSKIGSGKFEIDLAPFDLPALLREIELVFSIRARDSGLKFSVTQLCDTPCKLWGDAKRIKQILINLLGNAVKFTEEGGIAVTVAEEGGRLTFTVEDSGIGMSAEVIERLFQAFEQADNSISRRFGGTGLGLHISGALAEMMEGAIEVSSEEGRGSRFVLTIPYRASDLEIEPASEHDSMIGSEEQQRFVGEVLVVEDTPELQLLERRILEAAGATVTVAANGEVALELATVHQFDLILMDMQMPVMDGIEATQTLRNLGNSTPIVALTANVMQKHRRQFEEAGASGFLQKPIDRKELERILSLYLRFEEKSDSRQCKNSEAREQRLLVVDDESSILELYQHVLGDADSISQLEHELDALTQTVEEKQERQNAEMEPFDLVLCSQGAEAVATLRKAMHEGCPFQVAFIDMRMPPGINGLATAKALRELDPCIYIVFVSAYKDVTPQQIEEELGNGVLYLDKPFAEYEIVQLARMLLYSWRRDRMLDDSAKTVSPDSSRKFDEIEAVEESSLIDDELMQLFVDSTANKLDLLQAALAQHQWYEVRSIAHNLKGTAATFGEPQLSELGKQLQFAIDESRGGDEVIPLTERLIIELQRVLKRFK